MGQDHVDPGTTQEKAAAPPEGRENALARFPLSFMQESLWFMDQVAPGTSAYNLPEARRFRGRLDISSLQKSLDALVRRHESLRTVFRMEHTKPAQLILSPAPFALHVRDLSQRTFDESEWEAVLKAEAVRPFDLKRGPLARGTLFRLSPQEHVLLINLHHIICDQWSINLFFSELAEHYIAMLSNARTPSAELPVQYADFAVWQRSALTGPSFQKQLDYWREKLRGTVPGLVLATDYPRPPFPSYRGRTQFFSLPADLAATLKQVGREQSATLFMTLLAGFKLFLHRYCRQNDILVGSPMMRRDREEMQRVIGFFVNTHALRTDLEGDPNFIELLGRVRETVLGAEAHQAVSVEQVVRALCLERDPRSRSLFQLVCSLQPAPSTEVSWGELSVDHIEIDNGGAKFDWSLLFTETHQGLQLRCEYSTDLFEAASVTRRIRHFETLLRGIVAEPTRRLSQFPLLTDPERVRLLAQPQCASHSADSACLHERFAERAALRPEAPAVTFEHESLSYGELNSRANRLAQYLRRHHVGPETPVALYLERSLELVISIMAVLKAGGAYVPIDPAYPAERLRFILEDAGTPVLVTQSSCRQRLPHTKAIIICLDEAWPEILLERPENPVSAAKPENAAYIIYTSGSTGKPKGVVVTHQNVVRLFTETEPWFAFDSTDVWCLFHSYTFDFSVWELWGPLLYGGRLVVVPFLVSRSPGEFFQLLADEGVSVLNQTPSAFRQLLWAEAQASVPLPSSLRYIILGGEALELQSLRSWFERHGDDRPRLINMYGITETTVHVTYRVIREADLSRGSASLIGVPIPDLKLYLLDENLQPVPVGVPGEIFVGGAGVTRGYLNHPELTSQRFLPDLFAEEPGPKLYRSGDLARYTNQGELEYLGRLDEQVKIRGFRVELGEIESALNRYPGVRQSVVLAREAPHGGQQLTAYIVPAQPSCSVAEVRLQLSQILPEYMIPSAFMLLESLPLTINGKVDRRALPVPVQEQLPTATLIPPRNATEKLVAETWCELLGRSSIGIQDNFFHLGGHSLLATQVMSRLAAVLGCDLSVRLLFEAPTVAALAETIGRAQQEQPAHSSVIPRRIRRGEAERLLAQLDQLSPAELEELLHQSEGQPLSA
jgi:amino acid adenylation domain-containing protein